MADGSFLGLESYARTTSNYTMMLLFATVVACTVVLLDRLLRIRTSRKEPPFLSPKVPYIGHAIGLLWKKTTYFADLSMKYNLPAYSLAIPGMPDGRVYVLNSADLALAVQKQPKKFSYSPFLAGFACKFAGLSTQAIDAFQENVHAMHRDLKPGEAFDQMLLVTIRKIAMSMSEIGTNNGSRVELYDCISKSFVFGATTGVYGSRNPFEDPNIAQTFSEFEQRSGRLLYFPAPKLTCAKVYSGRETLVTAFEKYIVDGGPINASHLVQAEKKVFEQRDTSINDRARFGLVQAHGLLANTTPTAFWTLYHIYSHPVFLTEVREQVSPLLTTKKENGITTYTIDVENIREVTLLHSVLYESLRYYSSGTGVLKVLEDTMLDEKYLLRGNSLIFLPRHVFHFDRSSWGSTVNDFDPRRFVNLKSYPSAAFRGFGGGANVCPGRLFAMSEILSMCAMFALRYDMMPVSGKWIHPGVNNQYMATLIHPPKRRCEVKIVERKGWEGGVWAFRV